MPTIRRAIDGAVEPWVNPAQFYHVQRQRRPGGDLCQPNLVAAVLSSIGGAGAGPSCCCRLPALGAAEIRYNSVNLQVDGPVAWVTLARPKSGNRIDREMAGELREVCRLIGEDEEVRVLVITGRGRQFSVGREAPPESPAHESSEAFLEWLACVQVASSVAGLAVPVIASINGDALDHGLELALGADIRLAAREARLGLTDLGRGEFPWDGGTQRLPRLVGPAWARDMIFTGRIVEAPQALDIGLVNRVTEGDRLAAETRQLAASIAAGAPIAARYAKEAVRTGMDLSLEQGLRLEADLNILLHGTADRSEGLRSFLERRRPEFRGE